MRPNTSTSRVLLVCLVLCCLLLSQTALPPTGLAAGRDRRDQVLAQSATALLRRTLGAATRRGEWREGELVVRFREGVPEHARNAAAAAGGARSARALRGESRVERWELQGGQDAAAVAEELRLRPEVEFAEPNYLVRRAQVTPNDARYGEQWALRNTGQSGGTPSTDIGAARAWRTTTGARSTVVAVVDSGVDFTHPDLANNRWTNTAERGGDDRDDDRDGYADDVHGWDFVADSGRVVDEFGHGTSVAGVIAAEGDNRAGTAGVAWRASLMSLRVLDASGVGDVAAAVEAIDYAAAHGAAVINCSWGTGADSRALRDAIERAGRRGVVVVASAGNGGQSLDDAPYFPASYDLPNLISVAASDQFDNLASFSSWGADSVNLAAPGVDILTTRAGGDYRLVSGTSAAAPLVAGVAALVKSVRPNARPERVREAILGGARRVPTMAGKVSAGGVLDAAGALAALGGNPYASGQGGGAPYVPGVLRPDLEGRRSNGIGGERATPPAPRRGAPAANLPDLARSRSRRASPEAVAPAGTIRANLACADCAPPVGAGGNDPLFGTARTRSANETGEPGETLGSRNFNWSLPLVNLRGRAGHDLSLSLYYNSLVWTKQGTVIQYNADHGTPAPGFQLGLPRLQQAYYDQDSQSYAIVMVTPSGGRVEMRYVGPGLYESADGSFTQLTVNSQQVATVRTTDGTQYVFGVYAVNEWRCTEIKDRNGNIITATYDTSNGHLLSVTDTLGRVLNFNYDANQNLHTVTQAWGGQTHTYATFHYDAKMMAPNFNGLGVIGPQNGQQQTVLTAVALSTGESYYFLYNDYGQAYRVTRVAPDGTHLSRLTYTFNLAGAQEDCPRFTERRDWAYNWNNHEDAVTLYSTAENTSWTNPEDGQPETGSLAQQTLPDGTVVKQYAHGSGWDAGLPRLQEFWSGGERKKYTTTKWTQDDTSPSITYQLNPRVEEVSIYDAEGNRRRTTVEYAEGYNLPTHVREWGGPGGQQLLRMKATSYNLRQEYLERRIIGLPDRTLVFDAGLAVVSKVAYRYDHGNEFLQFRGNVAQHDPSYNAGHQWRGNVWSVARFDPNHLGDWTRATETRTGYDTNGSPIFTTDAEGHITYLNYADHYSDGNTSRPQTHAYVTTATDPDGYASFAHYHYDFGGVTNSRAPVRGTGASGDPVVYADEVVQYDAHGRVQQVTTMSGATMRAYKRWVYEPNEQLVHTYETVTGTAQSDELHSWAVMDGAGRVRASASDHPGSSGGFAGQFFVFDKMGRVVERSNPTEMTSGWQPGGDDSQWVLTAQTYDWQGRPRVTTNPDGSTRVLSYGGCGCAGGEVVTTQDEAGRKRRLTKDTLGRLKKVEELDWNGNVYSTTDYTFNARDQLTEISQQGQLRTFEYDTYGRLRKRTTPEQGTTEYHYRRDDTVEWARDARGAKTVFAHDARHLVTGVTYDLGGVLAGQIVQPTAAVGYEYDAAGHRTRMTDGHGSATYHYDELGRMDWEERGLTGVGAYRFDYGYNAAGQLTSVTYPQQTGSASVGYTYDRAGRVTDVTGANFAGVTSYASGIQYRAFGAPKAMGYGNGRAFAAGYDSRLRPTSWKVAGVLGYDYNYDFFGERTGRVTYAHSTYEAAQHRSYQYDHAGRLIHSYTGANARAHVGAPGGSWWQADGGPYGYDYEHDRWGNLTRRYGRVGEALGAEATFAYTQNRRDGSAYDASGNLTDDGAQAFTYDATGQQAAASSVGHALLQGYDGDGLRVKKSEDGAATYYLRSTVLGGRVVCEVSASGSWQRGYVYLGAQLLAVQQGGAVSFVHEDPVTKSKRATDLSGAVVSATETDPYGADTGAGFNSAFQPRKYTTYERDRNGSDEATFRRYNARHARFDQPDPYDGSYDLTDPQSFNRYSYTQNDPVNFVDPSGLHMQMVRVCGTYRWAEFSPDGKFVGWQGDAFQICNYVFAETGESGTGIGETGSSGKEPPIIAPKGSVQERLAWCLNKLYGLKLHSFSTATTKKDGQLVASGSSGRVQVTTNAGSYTSADLAYISEAYRMQYPERNHPAVVPGYAVLGLTTTYGMAGGIAHTPHLNYLANNAPGGYNSPAGIQRRQIHEDGHSLSIITGRSREGWEAGEDLETCVYGNTRNRR